MMGSVGLEPAEKTSRKRGIGVQSGAESGACGAVTEVIEAWGDLTPAARLRVLAVVRGGRAGVCDG
jgi:hypothetical protein